MSSSNNNDSANIALRKTHELRCMVASRYIPEVLPIVEALPSNKMGSFRIFHWALPEGLLVVAAVLERVEELAGGIVVHSRSGLLANPPHGKTLGVGDFGLRAKQAEREVERCAAGKAWRVVRAYRPGERRDGNVVALVVARKGLAPVITTTA